MQYRTVPKTGDSLSILGFGCMRLPQKKGKPGEGRIDKERAARQVYEAIDKGVNYLDTAMPYHMFNERKSAKIFYLARLYGAMGTEPAYASLCQECGKCEKACPQQLPIQTLLKDVAATFENRSLKVMGWLVGKFFSLQRILSLRRARKRQRW